jgi:peptide-methionine (S)-S-oxide reductase
MFLLNMLNNKLKMPPRENALPGRADALPTASHHFVNGNSLHAPFPEGTETALFGLVVSGARSASSGNCRACM